MNSLVMPAVSENNICCDYNSYFAVKLYCQLLKVLILHVASLKFCCLLFRDGALNNQYHLNSLALRTSFLLFKQHSTTMHLLALSSLFLTFSVTNRNDFIITFQQDRDVRLSGYLSSKADTKMNLVVQEFN